MIYQLCEEHFIIRILKSHAFFFKRSLCSFNNNRCKKGIKKYENRIYRSNFIILSKKIQFGIRARICSVSTLSRLEDGSRCADSLTSSLLLERIGKQICQFELLFNDADYELWLARESIIKNMQRKEYEQV